MVLIVGADVLVRAGAGLASWLGIRPMVIGLTVVSLGTSVPQLAIGIDAAVSGSPGLAVGNIVGTNLVNLLLILGLSAVLAPIVLDRATLRFDLPAKTAAAVLLCLLSIDGELTRPDGGILLLGGVASTAGLVQISRRTAADPAEDPATVAQATGRHRPVRQALLLVVAIGVVVIGAELLLVNGAVASARSLGVSDTVIGLTIIAIGPSAPELVTTVVSTLRGDRDLAVREPHRVEHLQHRRGARADGPGRSPRPPRARRGARRRPRAPGGGDGGGPRPCSCREPGSPAPRVGCSWRATSAT